MNTLFSLIAILTGALTESADGQFGNGSMGPKVEAAIDFVERTGGRAVIGPLDRIVEAVAGGAGTLVEREEALA